jgi:hypothetical protein
VRRRRFPIVGSGSAIWSFVHLADAAEATALAVERGEPGVYNVTDDEPAAVREWLPVFADAIGGAGTGARPRWLGRVLGGPLSVTMMTELRGASNAKAKRGSVGSSDIRHGAWASAGASADPRIRRHDERSGRNRTTIGGLFDQTGHDAEG